MRTSQRKRRSGTVLKAQKGLIVGAAVVAALLVVLCGSVNGTSELPFANKSEPALFHGEITKGLKIHMKLYRNGFSLRGTYLYEVFGREIDVKGIITEDGEIALQEFVKGKPTGNFEGEFVSKDRIEGRWYKKPGDKGRSFYLVSMGSPLVSTGVSSRAASEEVLERSASGQRPQSRIAEAALKTSVPREAAARPAPMIAEAPQQTSKPEKTEMAVSEPSGIQPPKTEPLRMESSQQNSAAVSTNEPLAEKGDGVSSKADVRAEENITPARGSSGMPGKKSGHSAIIDFLLNMKVAGAVAGILLLGGGLAWLAVIAGGAAAFRENSALFRQAHATGVSFLPGIVLLALGVGAVLAVFVE